MSDKSSDSGDLESSSSGTELEDVDVRYSNIGEEEERDERWKERDVDEPTEVASDVGKNRKIEQEIGKVTFMGATIFVILGICCVIAIFVCSFCILVIAGVIVGVIINGYEKTPSCPLRGSISFYWCIDGNQLMLDNPEVLKSFGQGLTKLGCLKATQAFGTRRSFAMTNSSDCYGVKSILGENFESYRRTSMCKTSCLPNDENEGLEYSPPVRNFGDNVCGGSNGQYFSVFMYDDTECEE